MEVKSLEKAKINNGAGIRTASDVKFCERQFCILPFPLVMYSTARIIPNLILGLM
jgi:hypothetical protein